MAYTEQDETIYTFYDKREEELIEKWLEDNNYKFWTPTVCGNCCGMYENFYDVGGIGGRWRDGDAEKFKVFANENNIPYSSEEIEHNQINPKED